jgi:hypothetical protein
MTLCYYVIFVVWVVVFVKTWRFTIMLLIAVVVADGVEI